MTVLYKNSSGKDVTHASYSSRQTYKKCPREFKLTRIDGWSDKAMRAAPIFGRCIESGLQAYEESDRRADTGVKKFRALWNEVKLMPEFKELIYTATEGSYDQLMESGTQMMRLYEAKASFLPIKKPIFQQKVRKTIFPGTNLANLENVAILDILSFPDWDHKMLLPVPHAEGCEFQPKSAETEQIDCTCREAARELIIDVKTSGKDFPTDLVALDPQLAEYGWQTRISDVAFLWFVKAGHGYKRGSRITLLEAQGRLWRGWEGLVIDIAYPEGPYFESGSYTENDIPALLYIGDHKAAEQYESAIKNLRGKTRTAAEKKAIDDGLADGSILLVSSDIATKQRLQFAAARLTEEQMNDTGRSVAQTTVEMVRSHEQEFYEQLPGIRFPNEKCGFCAMRWICLNRSDERDKNLTRRGQEWLDGDEDVE